MEKLFSIIVPVFNGQKYIQDTLNSIFSQTYKNFELIVIDGASTDDTLKILNNNKDKIDIIISEKDDGMYDALRKGFEIAKGEYFCYINSDDRLLPYSLELVAQKFGEYNYDLVFGDVNYISESGKLIYSYKALNIGHNAIRSLQRLPFAQQSAFWTKDIYNKKGGFDHSLKYVADSKFFFKVCLDPKVKKAYIKKPLGEFRLHSNSFSVGSSEKMSAESEKMRREFQFRNSICKRYFYEFMLKSINLIDLYKKKSYKGAKF